MKLLFMLCYSFVDKHGWRFILLGVLKVRLVHFSIIIYINVCFNRINGVSFESPCTKVEILGV